jgi:hypothetical protein
MRTNLPCQLVTILSLNVKMEKWRERERERENMENKEMLRIERAGRRDKERKTDRDTKRDYKRDREFRNFKRSVAI